MPPLPWLSRFIHAFTRKFTPGKTRSRFRWDSMDKLHRLRLRLEGLEDRTAPAIFTVLNTNDTGPGSLRDAVAAANGNTEADTIVFGNGATNFTDATPDTILLTSGAITFTGDTNLTTVTGSGARLLTVSGGNTQGVFWVDPGISTSISGMTTTGGNSATTGGGVNSFGILSLADCTISGNTSNSGNSRGGGVYSADTLTMSNCTVSGNTAAGTFRYGGGVFAFGTAVITNCTVTGNDGSTGGGVQKGNGADLTLINCTVSGNTADTNGGGVKASAGGTFTIRNSIVSGNSSPAGPDVIGGFNSLGNNLIGKTDGGTGWVGSDLTGTIASPLDARLGALANNGGPTDTLALLFNSPAINAGSAAAAPANDQRGLARFGGTDIGAFEYQFKVTSTADSGNGSLRQAILNANATAGTDTVVFRIGTGTQTIAPTSALPSMTQTVVIDGTTQPGYAGTPIIEVSGQNAGGGVYGPTVTSAGASNSVIAGLVVNRWAISGVFVTGGATGVVIRDNYIGTNVAGTADLGNGAFGVDINRAPGNTVRGNLISGNNNAGVVVSDFGTPGSATGNVVVGNRIGLNAGGTGSIPNALGGIVVESSNTTIGGTLLADRNIISGNGGNGIRFNGAAATGTVVINNYIGLAADGTTAIGNSIGILIEGGAATNTVGGTAAGVGNVIAGNTGNGVRLQGVGTTGNLIQGNTIGLNAAGAAAPNSAGVVLAFGPTGNTVGGTAAGAGNVISGNTQLGIQIDGATTVGNTLRQNRVYGNSGGQISLTNGGNRGQPAPILTGALGGSSTRAVGTLVGGAPNTAYLIELFSATVPGEARLPLGTNTFTTDALGNATFDIAVAGVVPFGTRVTATVTRLDTGDTSGLDTGKPAAGAIIGGIPVALAEGTPVTLTAFTAADPGGGQALAYNWAVTKNGTPYATSVEASITFTPDDEGAYVVTLRVTNSTGSNAVVGPITLNATNARPAPQIFGAPSAAQAGTAISLRGVGNDPGAADAVLYSWQVRDTSATGTLLFSGSGANFAFTPVTGGLYRVALTANDQDGGIATTAQSIIVSGGPALTTITAPAISDEGTPVRATAALSSLIRTDTLSYQWTVKKAGVPYPFTRVDEGGITFTPNDNGLYTVGLTVVSGGTAFAAAPAVVTVNNVNPQAAITGAPAAATGLPVTLTGVATDRGTADTATFQWSVVGPAAVPGGTGPVFTFTPPAAGDYVVLLTVRDDDGGSTTVARAVRVNASGLVVGITGAPATGVEGTAIALGSTIANPNGATFRYTWTVTRNGDPFATATSVTAANPTGFTAVPLPLVLVPTDNGTYVATLAVTASDGRAGAATVAVAVLNLAPTAAIAGGTGALFEGGPVPLTAVATDPGAADVLTYEWRVNGVLQPNGADPKLFTFTPPDNSPPATYSIGLTVRDDDGASATTSRSLTVSNVAPRVTVTSDPTATAADGSVVGLAAAVADPGTADTFHYSWTAVRNGTTTVATLAGSGAAFARFTYPAAVAGTYVVTLVVTDDDGGSATRTVLSVVGGAGNDVITITPAVIAAAGPGVAGVLVQGLGGNDTVTVDPAVGLPVVLDGGGGNDLLQGGSAADVLVAGSGDNTLLGGAGNDTLRGGGSDDLSGGFGDDYYRVHFSTVELFETGTGTDTIDLTGAPQGVTFDLSVQDGTAQSVFAGSTLAVTGPFEKVVGSDFGDVLRTATSGTNLFGGLGDDSLTVAGGIDVTIFGGEGRDSLAVAAGTDVTVFGGGGDDTLSILAGTDVTVFGGDGADTLSVGGGIDVTVFGGDGLDNIRVNGGTGVLVLGGNGEVVGTDVTLFGGAGADEDTITVGGGIDVTVFGGDGDDSLTVGGGIDVTVFGGEGRDTLTVLAGTDVTVFGDGGNDSLAVGGSGTRVTVFGGAGDDTLVVGGGAIDVTVFGGDGDDSLVIGGSAIDVTVFGGEGRDTLTVLAGTDVTVFGDAGNDSLTVAGGARVTVFGAEGDDTLSVGGGLDVTVFGGEGNDSLSVGGGAIDVTVFGGDGDDTLTVLAGTDVTVFGDGGDDSLTVASGTRITVFGGDGDDTLTVGGGIDVTVFGGEGRDTLTVLAGTDVTVFGDGGNDSLAVGGSGTRVTVFGGAGDDTLVVGGGAIDVTVFGDAGNDSLVVSGSGTRVTVFGGAGDDTLVVGGGAIDVTVFGDAGNDSLSVAGGTRVTVFGGDGADTLTVGGTAIDVTVFGGEGNDSLSVAGGTRVTVFGGDGDDTLSVGVGGIDVTVFGGEGNDSLSVAGGTRVTVFGGDGADTLTVGGTAIDVTVFGGLGDDTLTVTGGTDVTVFGNEGNDSLAVTGGTDVTVFGNEGDDTLVVVGGTDVTVFGGDGDDTLVVGGSAIDVTVFGGLGDDSLTVTGGTDVTVFGDEGRDTLVVVGGTDVTVFGGDGDDTLVVGGSAIDVTVFGGLGDDTLSAGGGTGVKLYGEVGDDVLTAAGGVNVTVAGGSGDDTLTATGGTGVVLLGGTGSDLLTAAGAGGVTLSGGAGDDVLAAAQAAGVYLFGDDGNDTYRFGATGTQAVRVKEILILDITNFEATAAGAPDTTKGGGSEARGSDTLDLSAFTGTVVSLAVFGSEADPLAGAQLVAAGFTLTIFGTFENVTGTAGNDTIIGNAAANSLDGGGGNDLIDGQGGDDTLTGGAGDDTLIGGAGSDTYVFAGPSLGADLVTEAANADSDSLDFRPFTSPLNLDLGSTAAQVLGVSLTLTLSDAAGVENVAGTAFSDAITGNIRDNILEGGAGDDTLTGMAGSDTYVFVGSGLGADRVVEAPGADADTLDFAQFDTPLTLDLANTAVQSLGAPWQSLTLSDAAGVENVVGTVYSDVIRGNARDNALYGAGGADLLDGRGGNDTLQGDFTQVVLLDFDTATSAASGDHDYTPAERAAVIARLQTLFGPFNYVFTTDPVLAAALTARSGRLFITLVFNDGAGGGIGGESNELDFGNRVHGARGTVNVNNLLGGHGQPAATSANIVALTATITAHELAHMAGLQHTDAFGPVGTGVYGGVAPTRFLPAYTGPAGANETAHHIMASPQSVGSTLFDAVGPTGFGEREAIKLAFNETGVARAEQATAAGGHETFATAEALGVLPGLFVPNTLLPGDRDYGKTFDVSAVAVVGTIRLNGTRSENDVYSFVGRAGDVMTFTVISGMLIPSRGNPIDGLLKLYGSNGQLLATNDDGPESTDPVILDFVLPADGIYYVVVDTYSAAVDLDVGRYELFMYRFATTTGAPAANLGDTIIGGAGSDTVIGSAADDTFRAAGALPGDVDVYHGKAGFDVLDLTGSPPHVYTANSVELVVGANQAPTLAALAPVVMGQGGAVTITPVVTDPDLADRLTFTLTRTGQSGDVFPAGATVDPRTGVVRWVASRAGTYRMLISVTDAAGATVSQLVTIEVPNVAPAAAVGGGATLFEGGTLTRAGSFADPGADTWTATVDYGDGTGVQSLALNLDKTFTLSHAYADNGTYTVTVVVNDGFASSVPATFTVVVSNTAPTAVLSNGGSVNEGGAAGVSFAGAADVSAADGTAGFRYSFALSVGGLAGSYAAASTTASAAFAFPASGTYTVFGRVIDKDNGYTDYTTTVAVANVAPTVAAVASPGMTVTAGTPFTLTGSFADPGNDVAPAGLSWAVTASNGQVVSAGSGTAFAFTPNAEGTYTVVFKATDADGAAGVTMLQLVALRPAPVGVLTNSGPVVEGGTATVTLTPTNVIPADWSGLRFAYDFDNDGTFDLGTGTYAGSVSANAAAVPAAYLSDGPFSRLVRARVIDVNGSYTDTTTTIAVTNAVPAVAAGGAVQVTEAAPTVARSGSFADSGADTWTAEVNYGAGGGWVPLALHPDKTFALNHVYADSGNYTITVWVTDDNGGVGTASFAVSVANVAATAVLGNGGAVNEGSAGSVSFTGAADPSPADTTAGFRYSYDFDNDGVFEVGDGTYAGSVTATGAVVPAGFLADGPWRTVRGRVIDKDGGFSDLTTTITVNNTAPVVTAGGNASLPAGGVLSRTGRFTDPGADTWTAEVNYGAGGGWVPLALNPDKTFALSHTYTISGVFTVSVRVTDDDLGTDTKTFTVAVNTIPTAAVAGATSGVRGQARTFLLSAADSADDLAAGFVYTIHWGDGSPAQTVARTAGNGAGVSVEHVFAAAGTYTASVTATDLFGQASPAATRTVTIAVAQLQTEGSVTSLVVGGSIGGERIRVRLKEGSTDYLVVRINDTDTHEFRWRDQFAAHLVNRITIYGQAGDDRLKIDPDVVISAELFGGDGEDTLEGGGGPDIIVGGAGDDRIRGGDGRDLLIGGAGADRLWGEDNDDVLIAAFTLYDSNLTALRAILAEWSSANSYAARVTNLRDGGGLNGPYLLNAATVGEDGAQDALSGQQGQDWFLITAPQDNVTDEDQSEWFTETGP